MRNKNKEKTFLTKISWDFETNSENILGVLFMWAFCHELNLRKARDNAVRYHFQYAALYLRKKERIFIKRTSLNTLNCLYVQDLLKTI